MSAELLGRHEPNTPEWDSLRANGLGGSEIAAVVGLSPWESAFSLWHRKVGTIGKQEVNAGMAWGTRLEDVICDAWAETRDVACVKAGTYRHTERQWQLANVDRLVATNREFWNEQDDGFLGEPQFSSLLEAKTAHQYDAHEWGAGPEDIPPYYRTQVVWYMDVLGVPAAHLAVLIGGSDYREYEIAYDATEAEWLREQGRLFWQTVLDRRAPAIDGSDATYEAVRATHPEIESGIAAQIDADLYAQYVTTKEAAERAATDHKQAKSQVLEQIGQAQYGEVDKQRVLRRQSGRGGSVSLYPVPQPKFTSGDAA